MNEPCDAWILLLTGGRQQRRADVVAAHLRSRGWRCKVAEALSEEAARAEIRSRVPTLIGTLGSTAGRCVARDASIPCFDVRSVWDAPLSPISRPEQNGRVRPSVTLFADLKEIGSDTAHSMTIGPLTPPGPPRGEGGGVVALAGRPPCELTALGEALSAELTVLGGDDEIPDRAEAVIIGPGVEPYPTLARGVPVVGVIDRDELRAPWQSMDAAGFGVGVEPGERLARRLADAVRRARARAPANLAERLLEAPAEALAAIEELVAAILAGLRGRVPRRGPPIDGMLRTRARLIEEIDVSTPPSFGRTALDRALDGAVFAGLESFSEGAETRYDRGAALDWLDENCPAYHEAHALARHEVRAHADLLPQVRGGRCCPERDAGPVRLTWSREQRYDVTLRFDVDTEDLEQGARLRLFLPYPKETPAQRDIALVEADDAITAALVPELAYVYGAEYIVAGSTLDVSYRCRISSHETHLHGVPTEGLGRVRASSLDELVCEISRLPHDAIARAFAIFDWMMENVRYGRVAIPCICPDCSSAHVDRHRTGHCILLSQAFVGIARRVGLRARPVRGALFTYPRPTRSETPVFGWQTLGEPPYAHTWVELEVPGIGLVPVEMHPVVFKTTSARNCLDPELRRARAEEAAFLRRFYFGGMDAQRVIFSESVLALPLCLVEDRRRPPEGRWQPLGWDRVRFAMEATPS
jgi:hypothetical protein